MNKTKERKNVLDRIFAPFVPAREENESTGKYPGGNFHASIRVIIQVIIRSRNDIGGFSDLYAIIVGDGMAVPPKI